MSFIKTMIMGVMLTIALASCKGQSNAAETFSQLPTMELDTTSFTTVTITKVKKPWYAWRGLVLGKMEKTIPQYQAINGLGQKLYLFTAKGNRFGGIYFWQRQQDASNWFNPAWFERTRQQYGEVGVVESYRMRSLIRYASFTVQQGDYWCVLTRSAADLDLPVHTVGIIQKLQLTDQGGSSFYLTVWKDKASAEEFFGGKQLENEYFDTPLAITNGKK